MVPYNTINKVNCNSYFIGSCGAYLEDVCINIVQIITKISYGERFFVCTPSLMKKGEQWMQMLNY